MTTVEEVTIIFDLSTGLIIYPQEMTQEEMMYQGMHHDIIFIAGLGVFIGFVVVLLIILKSIKPY
jgi:hypothetical protein